MRKWLIVIALMFVVSSSFGAAATATPTSTPTVYGFITLPTAVVTGSYLNVTWRSSKTVPGAILYDSSPATCTSYGSIVKDTYWQTNHSLSFAVTVGGQYCYEVVGYCPSVTATPYYYQGVNFQYSIATPTPTFTDTPTHTLTYTNTPTHTLTVTHTPTETYTPTQTLSPTETFTPTQTFTPTETFTPTYWDPGWYATPSEQNSVANKEYVDQVVAPLQTVIATWTQ